MALTPLGKIATINTDLTSAVYEDSTVYGAPEVDRNQVGVTVHIVKKSKIGVETELMVTSDDNDPATDDEWTFSYPEDGWFRVYMLIVPNYSGAATYTIYQAVYDTATKKFYRSKTNGNTGNALTDETNWEELETPGKTLAEAIDKSTESDNITYTAIDDLLRGYAERAYTEFVSADSLLQPQEFEAGASDQVYWALGTSIEGMSIARTRSLWSDGEKIARKAEQLIELC